MASTQNREFSHQVALNRLAGNTGDTGKTEQQVFNTANGSSGLSLQEILNTNMSTGRTQKSVQEALFNKLKVPLSLTGHYTQYSEQQLLNLAANAATPILTVIGK